MLLKRIWRGFRTFITTNGLHYTLIAAILIIIFSAWIYSHFEKSDFLNSIWWALVTTTTVGYGDISPQTVQGKITAVVLMFLGIGLISSITSTTSAFFQNKIAESAAKTSKEIAPEPVDQSNQADQITALTNKITQLEQKIDALSDKLN